MKDKPKHPGGRPTSLTAAVQRAIVETLRAGNYIDTACKVAGVKRQTFYNWVERGKAGESPFAEFFDACEKALSDAESSAVKSIQVAGKKNWQALAWWLERRHRARWAKNSDLSGNGGANSTPSTPAPNAETPPKSGE